MRHKRRELSFGANLFKVGELNELHCHFGVLHLHDFAHAGLGVSGGQADHSLQSSSRYGRSLKKEKRLALEHTEAKSGKNVTMAVNQDAPTQMFLHFYTNKIESI